MAITKIRGVKT